MQTIMPAQGSEGVVQTAVRLPLWLRERYRAEARSLGRSLNTHIVMCLSERAAGGEFDDQAPAAGSNNAALERGVSINEGKKGAHDECSNA